MIKNLRKGNAIPLLLSRINKTKVYRGQEREPGESQKKRWGWPGVDWLSLRGGDWHISTPSGQREQGTARHRPSLQLDYFALSFVCDLPLSDRTVKHARGWWSLPASFWGSDEKKGEAAVIQQLLLDKKMWFFCCPLHSYHPVWINCLLSA